MIWALVPVKKIADAKQRLSDVLAMVERKALFVAMLRDVLSTLRDHPSLERIFVVSADEEVRELACGCGAEFIDEAELGVKNLNEAVTAAAECLEAMGADQLLIIHGDLPLINADALTAIMSSLNSLGRRGVVIGTDHLGQGSNCLGVSPPSVIPFAYGEYSCYRHRQFALERQVPLVTTNLPALAQDIDSSDDLISLIESANDGDAPHTFAYLRRSGLIDNIGERYRLKDKNSAAGSNDLECG